MLYSSEVIPRVFFYQLPWFTDSYLSLNFRFFGRVTFLNHENGMIDCNIVPEKATSSHFLLLKFSPAEKLISLKHAVEIVGKLNTVDASVIMIKRNVDWGQINRVNWKA
jgi:hypothetical protein